MITQEALRSILSYVKAKAEIHPFSNTNSIAA